MYTSHAYLMQLNQRPPHPMVRGSGSYMWDSYGTRYLDFIQGWAVNCLGHSPPVLVEAIASQLALALNVGPAFFNPQALALAEKLARASGFDQVFLASSGVEANEAAVKLARKWGQKHRQGAYEVITTRDSFHGRTLAMTCATGKPGFEQAFPPAVSGFPKVPYDDIEALRAAIGPLTVGIMVEPMQGEAGVVVPQKRYLRDVRRLCDEHGILMLVDEVQTGMGRTGPLFAHLDGEQEAQRADIMTLGKGLGGGLPVSAMLTRNEVACFEHGDHGSTFAGHALMCAAANAVFDTLTSSEHLERQTQSAQYFEQTLRKLADAERASLRGRGHLWALVLPNARAEQVRDRCFELGLLINAPRPHVLRLMPALDVGAAEIDEMAELLGRALPAP